MTTPIDLRDHREEEQRDRLFDALDGLEDGSSISIVADRDLNASPVQLPDQARRRPEWGRRPNDR